MTKETTEMCRRGREERDGSRGSFGAFSAVYVPDQSMQTTPQILIRDQAGRFQRFFRDFNSQRHSPQCMLITVPVVRLRFGASSVVDCSESQRPQRFFTSGVRWSTQQNGAPFQVSRGRRFGDFGASLSVRSAVSIVVPRPIQS